MTEQQAIAEFRERIDKCDFKEQIPDYIEAMEMAIKALEKEIPKYELRLPPHSLLCVCPVCNKGVITQAMNYCPRCGDKLEWSE